MKFVITNLAIAGALGVTSCGGDGAAPLDQSDETPALSQPMPQMFTVFESGQVRPLAISTNRRFVYATNTPDNRVEIFRR